MLVGSSCIFSYFCFLFIVRIICVYHVHAFESNPLVYHPCAELFVDVLLLKMLLVLEMFDNGYSELVLGVIACLEK